MGGVRGETEKTEVMLLGVLIVEPSLLFCKLPQRNFPEEGAGSQSSLEPDSRLPHCDQAVLCTLNRKMLPVQSANLLP